ncbi:keratin, type II cytoskeletal 60 kDa, component III-like [Mytilus trossulus]|uniref:keratin, type II cytoskeletal 60 kDa, component III-like n=1 Tax=Mytilus trossulus TaxID=6551 RepID=UPI0030059BF0
MTMVVLTVLLLTIVKHVYGQQYFGRNRGYGAFSGFERSGRGIRTGGRFGGGSRGSLAGRLCGVSKGGSSGFTGGLTMGGPGFGIGSSGDRKSSSIDMGGGG